MAIRRTLFVFFISLLAGSHADALTIKSHFSFSGPFLIEENVEGVAISADFGSNPLTVTPTGGLIDGLIAQNDLVDAIRGDWGLGLLNKNVPKGEDRSTLFNRIHVDGSNQPEVLTLEFSKPVRIDKVFFSFVGPFETFDFAVDGVDMNVAQLFGTEEIYRMAPAGMVRGTVLLPETLPYGQTWQFFARSYTDEWNIESLAVTAVPEPSALSGLLALSIVGGLGCLSRRLGKRKFAAAKGAGRFT